MKIFATTIVFGFLFSGIGFAQKKQSRISNQPAPEKATAPVSTANPFPDTVLYGLRGKPQSGIDTMSRQGNGIDSLNRQGRGVDASHPAGINNRNLRRKAGSGETDTTAVQKSNSNAGLRSN